MHGLYRRSFLGFAFAALAMAMMSSPARAAGPQPFEEKAFRAAQAAGKAVLVDVNATW